MPPKSASKKNVRPKRAAKPKAKASAAGRKDQPPLLRAMLAVSLDGYIADARGGVGWLDPYFSPEIDFMGFMKTIGATVMGRTTYDWSIKQGHGSPGAGRTIVLTRRPLANPPAGVEVFSGDTRELAARLREELAGTGRDIWLMGGGNSLAAFHEHGLVDRWELGIIPVLLGDGIPLFPKHARGLDALRLAKSRTLSNGIVEAAYERQQGRKR